LAIEKKQMILKLHSVFGETKQNKTQRQDIKLLTRVSFLKQGGECKYL
jgi:hypothetical protein